MLKFYLDFAAGPMCKSDEEPFGFQYMEEFFIQFKTSLPRKY